MTDAPATSRPVAVVTGASSGIGLAFARQLASQGWLVVGVGRDRERLEALASETNGEALIADLLDTADLERVAARIRRGIDLLVNNAGFTTYGSFRELDPEREVDQLLLHAVVPLRLCHAAAQTMGGGGRIINVASLAGLTSSPGLASYAASKAALISLSEALHDELAHHGITVTCVCPGYTRTELQARAGVDASALPSFMWSDADSIVRSALKASKKGRALVIPEAPNAISAHVLRHLPRATARRISAMTVAKVRPRTA